ncbi:MAG TPA: DUF2157 domain-containing protein [Kineosporiaceae bacterium]|jgi:hypothetical protein|nr:DUF2157 domain-containing protein [Kineosporiaceae bacterium]
MEHPVDHPSAGGPGRSVDAALSRLVTDGTLTPEQADAVRRELSTQPPPGPSAESDSWTPVLAEVGGYVGGAFVAAAAVVLVGRDWAGLGTGARIAVLGVPALLLLAGAGVVALTTPGGWRVRPVATPPGGRWHSGRFRGARRRLVAVFVALAAALTGGVGAVIQDRVWSGHGQATAGTLSALVVVGAGYAACRSELLHLGAAVALVASAVAVLNETFGVTSSGPSGWAVSGAGLVWLGLTIAGLLDERALGLGAAGTMGFLGGELLTGADPKAAGYLLLFGVAVAGVVGYVLVRLLLVLIIGVATLAVVVPQVILDVTDGALGASGALLVVGLSIVGASVLGLRLHRAQ